MVGLGVPGSSCDMFFLSSRNRRTSVSLLGDFPPQFFWGREKDRCGGAKAILGRDH